VKRAVYARDEGQCTFVAEDGRRCSERGGVQYHHEIPFAKGGASTEDNIRLLCAAHNALHARRDYGADVIAARARAAIDARATSPKTATTLAGSSNTVRNTAQLPLCSKKTAPGWSRGKSLAKGRAQGRPGGAAERPGRAPLGADG